jgi:hypothetical protein
MMKFVYAVIVISVIWLGSLAAILIGMVQAS